jgi:hypothetical protein
MRHLTYLSLGAGVQSTAMLVMSVLGLRDCWVLRTRRF